MEKQHKNTEQENERSANKQQNETSDKKDKLGGNDDNLDDGSGSTEGPVQESMH